MSRRNRMMMHPRHHLSLAAAAAVWLLALLCLLLPQSSHGFLPPSRRLPLSPASFTATTSSSARTAEKIRVSPPPKRQRRIPSSSSFVMLHMGFLDNVKNAFLQDREGDFIKLDADDQQAYGPGPLLVLCNCPAGVTKNEIMDMLEDGAPLAFAKGITLFRCNNDNNQVLDKSMQKALEGMANGSLADNYEDISLSSTDKTFSAQVGGMSTTEQKQSTTAEQQPIVVTFFSGFTNSEMLKAYGVLAQEIYAESGWQAACAKAVPNAMQKPLRQVIEEIGGDHRDAMRLAKEEQLRQQSNDERP